MYLHFLTLESSTCNNHFYICKHESTSRWTMFSLESRITWWQKSFKHEHDEYVMTTLLTYQGSEGTQSQGTGRKKTYNHTPWQTLYTLHWLKSVILPLINTNIWQKLINRSFAMLIYQAEIVGPPSIFRSIIHLSIQPTHNSLQEDAHSRISQFLLARALGSNVFYDLW